MPGQIRQIAAFLDIPIAASTWAAMLEHCSFEYMKQHATLSAPGGGIFWEGGAQTFIYKGTNGRWREVLSQAESEQYEVMAREKLGAACAHWLATGELLEEPGTRPGD